MHRNTKVATCCYCGTRAALVLDRGRHELVCSMCGAPLGALKSLKSAQPHHVVDAPTSVGLAAHRPRKARRPKRKVPSFRRALAELIDEIEDIFD